MDIKRQALVYLLELKRNDMWCLPTVHKINILLETCKTCLKVNVYFTFPKISYWIREGKHIVIPVIESKQLCHYKSSIHFFLSSDKERLVDFEWYIMSDMYLFKLMMWYTWWILSVAGVFYWPVPVDDVF